MMNYEPHTVIAITKVAKAIDWLAWVVLFGSLFIGCNA